MQCLYGLCTYETMEKENNAANAAQARPNAIQAIIQDYLQDSKGFESLLRFQRERGKKHLENCCFVIRKTSTQITVTKLLLQL